jgi:hypothetical protein
MRSSRAVSECWLAGWLAGWLRMLSIDRRQETRDKKKKEGRILHS